MSSSFSTDLVALWTEDSKPLQEKRREQGLEHRGGTAQRRYLRLTCQLYKTELWENICLDFFYILGLIRLKSIRGRPRSLTCATVHFRVSCARSCCCWGGLASTHWV